MPRAALVIYMLSLLLRDSTVDIIQNDALPLRWSIAAATVVRLATSAATSRMLHALQLVLLLYPT